jgi:spermidine/putrescine transport system permease protein
MTTKRVRLVKLNNFPFFSTVSWLGLFALYAPLLVVIFYSFNVNRFVQIWHGFSIKWYFDVLDNTDIARALTNSLTVAAFATVISTVLAIMATLGLLRLGRAGSAIAWGLIGAPLIIPEIVLAIGTLSVFLAIKIPLGFTALVLAHTAFCIPFAMLPIRARLQSLDTSPFEAANDLGANEWKIFRHITLPLLAPGILSGALLAFAISIDDFIMSFFLAGPGATTLPVYIFGMIRSNITPAINALSTMLLVFSGVMLSLSFMLNRVRR